MEPGRNGGWIPVVNQWRGGGSRGYEARNGLYTVFVDNIPRSADANSLFKLFKKFGVVKDVFIPFKRRIGTNSRFGFVRFNCSVASDIAIQKANGLLVDDKVLVVTYATHDRSMTSRRRPHAITAAFNPNRGAVSVPVTSHQSYAEVLQRGKTMTINVKEDGHGWLYESVIIRLNSDYFISSIRSALKDCGLPQVVVRHGGGRDVILTFKSQDELQSNIQKVKDLFKDWSQSISEWKPGAQIKQERCVWLKCFGIPLNLWNRDTLNKIGALWGSVLSLEGDLSHPQSFSYSRVKIVTIRMELINTTINLECKGRLHQVLVCEDHSAITPDCQEWSKFGLSVCNTSSNVASSRAAENVLTDGACNRKDKADSEAIRQDCSGAAVVSSMNVIHGKDHSPCNSTEEVGTVVEDSLCSRPTIVGTEQTMMEERLPYPTCNVQPQKCDEEVLPSDGLPNNVRQSIVVQTQRCDEQALPSGLPNNLSKSIDEFGPGINLEVNLGCPNFEQIIQGPSTGINLEVHMGHPNNINTNSVILAQGPIPSSTGLLGSKPGLFPLSPIRCPDPILNPQRYAKKAGKKKVFMEGFSQFARHYGHTSAATSKHSSKSIIFRPAAVALARSELSEGDSSLHSYLLKEAQATVQVGKELGIDFRGKECSMVDRIIELELKDKERIIRDGKAQQ